MAKKLPNMFTGPEVGRDVAATISPQRFLQFPMGNFQMAPIPDCDNLQWRCIRFPGLRVPGSLGARQPLCPARLRTRGAAACVRGESGSWPRGAPASTVAPHIPGA